MAVVDLYEPETYVDAPPHEVFTDLRRTDPVHWQATPDGGGYWMVLKHADVVEVSRQPEVFSAAEGGVVIEDLPPENLAMMRKMLLAMDPPDHVIYRREVSPSFKARVIAGLEDRIRVICGTIIDRALERGDVDFVHEVCAYLPSQVIGELMGLPVEDWPRIHQWAERNSGGQDPDINPEYDRPDNVSPSMEMAFYAIEFAAQRRALATQPEDLTSVILSADFNGEPMTDLDFGSFFVQLVTAGNDTTRTMLSSGLWALLEHPDQLESLRRDPSGLPAAVEEILRWANPLHYFRRTALSDYELRGTSIATGDKVAMMYTSANRDEDVFADPQSFHADRSPNPHLSFGIGEHFCLGVHLARLEGRVFFEELLNRCATIEQTGPARRQQSNLNNALKALPVHLAA